LGKDKSAHDKVKIVDVARAAGVSPMTVSRVLNGRGGAGAETTQRVLTIARELNYSPNPFARGLRSDKSGTVGLLVPDITNPFFPEIIRGAESAADKAGYNLLLCNVIEDSEREGRLIKMLLQHRVDGVIVCSPRLPNPALHAALKEHRAVVLINRSAPSETAGTVITDYAAGATKAVEHLVSRGRRRIAVIAGPRNSFGGKRRLDGIASSMDKAGLASVGTVYCPPGIEGGREATAELLRHAPGLDAIICYNDLIAIGAVDVCRGAGLDIPGRVALVGFDDIPVAALVSPALTTIRVEKHDLGELAMRLLLDRIGNKFQKHSIVVDPELIVRETT